MNSCEVCGKCYVRKGDLTRHMTLKHTSGLVYRQPYAEVKTFVDTVLNRDKSLFTSSNDEPTPIGCVEEMLTAVPRDVWSRPGLRVLDPCCGTGNFHLVITERLREAGRTPQERATSLQFNDINDARLHHVRELFGETANITRNDFLAMPDEESYDMVVMNPPYAKMMANGDRASKNHGLSTVFLRKGLRVLKPGGFLIAIVPDSWMSLADRNTVCTEMTAYQFHALNIHCAKTWFPKVGSSFTWFVVEKVPGTLPFPVSYRLGREVHTSCVESQGRAYIPLTYSALCQSIFAKTVDNDALPKYTVETSSDLHRYTKRDLIQDTQDDAHPYRLIHTPKQTAWASRPHKVQEGWKVFLSTTDKYGTFVDCCGMTQSIAYIRVEDETNAKRVASRLMHPLYVFLNNACRYGNFNNIRILQRFPVCTTEDPCSEFGLTDQERALVYLR